MTREEAAETILENGRIRLCADRRRREAIRRIDKAKGWLATVNYICIQSVVLGKRHLSNTIITWARPADGDLDDLGKCAS